MDNNRVSAQRTVDPLGQAGKGRRGQGDRIGEVHMTHLAQSVDSSIGSPSHDSADIFLGRV
jgi:hypothetical protein